MKNKICLIMLFAMLFVCVFAVAVSAEETDAVPEWPSEVTILDGMSDKATFGADGKVGATSRVLMSDGKAYPAYYIIKDSSTLGVSFDEINKNPTIKALGITYSQASVVRLEVPNGMVTAGQTCIGSSYSSLKTITLPNTLTTIGAGAFKIPTLVSINLPNSITSVANNVFNGCTSLKSIVIPSSITEIPQTMFYGCTALETVDFSNATSLTSIGYQAFYNCTALESAILPEGLTTIENLAFKYTGVKTVYLPSTLETIGTNNVFGECSKLETIRSKAKNIPETMFYNASNLSTLILEDTLTIGDSAFYKATSLESLTLPNTITKIGKNVFAYAAFDKIIVPASVTEFGDGAFKENDNLVCAVVLGTTMGSNMFLNCSNMTKLVITENFTTFGSSALNGVNRASFTTFYTGKNNDFDTIKGIITLDRVSSAKPSSYEDYKAGTHTQNKYIFIYGANLCDVAYGEHNIPSPTYYFTSYTEESAVKGVCTRCGIEHIEETVAPLFSCLGFSSPDDSFAGISIGFRVDHEAVLAYERITSSTVSYGLFVGVYEKLGNEDVINLETGEIAEDAVVADLSEGGFVLLKLKIAGFTKDEQKASMFAVGTYVINGDNISYVQANNPTAGQKYYYTSYNNIVK